MPAAARIEVHPLKEGLSLIAAGDIDDLGTRRLELAMPAFRAWPVPDPDRGDWAGWEQLLGSARAPPGEPATAAMRFRTDGYGTVSSALIALPARSEPDLRPVFRFAGMAAARRRRGRTSASPDRRRRGDCPARAAAAISGTVNCGGGNRR